MKAIMSILSIVSGLLVSKAAEAQVPASFYDFTVQTIDGKNFSFSQLKGKKVMIVNTASKCGYTPQYAELEQLYKLYGGDKFEIIGFPANNFLWQEPGTNDEIKNFCSLNYGVTFPMMAKISVKGDSIHPLYIWLTQKKYNGTEDSKVKWNFQKYLIDEDGKLVKVLDSATKPMDKVVVNWLAGKN